MTPFGRHVHKTPPNGEAAFTSSLRFELVDEDERALLGSYAIASSLGVAFLLLIQFGPRMPLPIESARIGIIVGELNPFREPTPIRNSDNEKRDGRPDDGATRARATGKITNAFSGSAGSSTVGQPTNILGGVTLTPSGGATPETGGKTVLGYGKGGDGSLAPLRGGISSGSGKEIGGVGRGGSVAHASQQVVVPPAIAVDPLPPLSDVGTVGTFVRGHEAQLRFCYEESGLAANPKLAGSITVALTVAAGGSVTTASVTKRSWGGPGAAEAEACILRAVRGWRLPASGRAASTYSFPFNFSR
jgi:hypothetical protein